MDRPVCQTSQASNVGQQDEDETGQPVSRRSRAKARSVPPEFRSAQPDQLRELSVRLAGVLNKEDRELLLSAAAEIEGAEDAFGAVVLSNAELRQKLANTDELLQRSYDLFRSQSSTTPI